MTIKLERGYSETQKNLCQTTWYYVSQNCNITIYPAIKVKAILEHATRAQRWSRGVALLFL